MTADLSAVHELCGNLFTTPSSAKAWDTFRLSAEQVRFFGENGYCAGVRMLNDEQVAQLREQLADLTDPNYPGNELFHEYHSNESKNPETVLFHALGAWRIKSGFHDVLWNPRFLMPASQLLDGAVRFWTTSFSASRRGTAGWSRGTRIIPTGRGRSRWSI